MSTIELVMGFIEDVEEMKREAEIGDGRMPDQDVKAKGAPRKGGQGKREGEDKR